MEEGFSTVKISNPKLFKFLGCKTESCFARDPNGNPYFILFDLYLTWQVS
jgi:hypothetical protein